MAARALPLLLVVLSGACARGGGGDAGGGSSSSSSSSGGAADTMPLPPDSIDARLRATSPDSLTGLGDVVPPRDSSPAPPPPPSLPPPATATADSGEVAPTASELATLRAELAMPLAGVDPTKLPDTFLEARGGGSRLHHALDIPAPRGTPVLSAAAGRVLKLYTSDAGGLMVYAADESERFVLMYAHLDAYAPGLRDGMPLVRGQTIGAVGTTGNAPPNVPHLHFAIARTGNVARWWTGTPVDPRPLLQPGVP